MLREPSQSRRTNSARFHPRELLKTGKFVEAERNGGFQGLGSGDRGSNQQAWRFGGDLLLPEVPTGDMALRTAPSKVCSEGGSMLNVLAAIKQS